MNNTIDSALIAAIEEASKTRMMEESYEDLEQLRDSINYPVVEIGECATPALSSDEDNERRME